MGFVPAAIAGMVLSMIFAALTQYLLSNQVATGLALTITGGALVIGGAVTWAVLARRVNK